MAMSLWGAVVIVALLSVVLLAWWLQRDTTPQEAPVESRHSRPVRRLPLRRDDEPRPHTGDLP